MIRRPVYNGPTAAEWNERYPIGTNVVYRSVRGEQEGTLTFTRSEAWELGHGEPVVKIEGVSGGVALWALTVVRDAPTTIGGAQ